MSRCSRFTPLRLALCGLVSFSSISAQAEDELDGAFYKKDGRPIFVDPDSLDTAGFRVELQARTVYNSNLFLDSSNEQDDISTTIAPRFIYRTAPEGGARTVMQAYYSPSYTTLANNNQLDGANHLGQININYDNQKTRLFARYGYRKTRASDRFVGDYTITETLDSSVGFSYDLGHKIELEGKLSRVDKSHDQVGLIGSVEDELTLRALWKFSPRLKMGLVFKVGEKDTEGSIDEESWGVLWRTDYTWTQNKLQLTSEIGTDFHQYSGVGANSDAARFSGFLSARYLSHDRLSFDLSFYQRNLPSPALVNYYIEAAGVQLNFNRRYDLSTIRGGVAYERSTYRQVGTTATPRGDDDYFTVFLAYDWRMLSDRLLFQPSVRYSTSTGGSEWNDFQASLGFDYVF